MKRPEQLLPILFAPCGADCMVCIAIGPPASLPGLPRGEGGDGAGTESVPMQGVRLRCILAKPAVQRVRRDGIADIIS